jgi:hypothetical protein
MQSVSGTCFGDGVGIHGIAGNAAVNARASGADAWMEETIHEEPVDQ